MNIALKSMRSRLNLSQHTMANLLGISKSLYAKAESLERKLSSEALLKLAQIEKIIAAPPQPAAGKALPQARQSAAHAQALKKLYDTNSKFIELNTAKLQRMQDDYADASRVLHITAHLHNGANKGHAFMLKAAEREYTQKLKTCNPLQQETMHRKLEAAKFACTLCNTSLMKIKNLEKMALAAK